MSKLTVQFHRNHVATLPALKKPEGGEVPATILRPGENRLDDSVIEAWKDHGQVKGWLMRGGLGGLEITAEDGQHVDHEEILQAMYGDALPSAADRLAEWKAEQMAQARFLSNAAKASDDIKA